MLDQENIVPICGTDQLDFFQEELLDQQALQPKSNAHTVPINLDDYDRFIVAFSGGKDSVACVLHLLESGVSSDKVTLHHHNVDGEETGQDGLMDWPVTTDYCRKVAEALGCQFSQSWRVGGFEGEMMRRNQPTAPISIPYLVDGVRVQIGGEGKPNTRLKFPQVTANLATRWCSSSLKISCMDAWIRNDPQFLEGKTLVITGERAEESKSRANYHEFEPHRSDNRNGLRVIRVVDHWRPVHKWSEREVWSILERWKLTAHPSYQLGFGRCSCRPCIFGNKDQWATIKLIAPNQFRNISQREGETGLTIHRTLSVSELAEMGRPYTAAHDSYWTNVGNSHTFDHPVISDNWVLPAGAFGESCGPS